MAIQIKRTTTGGAPTGLQPGQLAVEMGPTPPLLWVGVPTSVDPSGRKLITPEAAGLGHALSTTATGTFNLNNVRATGFYYATNWQWNAAGLNLPPGFVSFNPPIATITPFILRVEDAGTSHLLQTITALASSGYGWTVVAPGTTFTRRMAHGGWWSWEQQSTAPKPPTLEIQMMYNGPGSDNNYFKLSLVDGTLLPEDRVFLLRASRSGYGTRRKDRSYDHYLYGWVTRYSNMWQGVRQGFRHPPHRGPGVPWPGTIGRYPNWGFQQQTEWMPQFHPRPLGNQPFSGSSMFMYMNWREVMRYRSLHRTRGTERFKFVIARPGAHPHRYWQFGDCLNTLIVRSHHHRPANQKIFSVTVRP
jgi:hypothetical protein